MRSERKTLDQDYCPALGWVVATLESLRWIADCFNQTIAIAMSESAKRFVVSQLERTGLVPNGPNPADPQIHNEGLWGRVLRDGTLGLGEAYMEGDLKIEQGTL